MAKEYSGVKLDVTFTKASTRENIISAENIALSFGKLAKWYTDFAWSAWTAPTVEVTGSGNAITSALYGTGTNANKLTLTKGTTFLTSDTQFIKAITSSGSGGAVTGMSVSSGTLTYTLGNPHPTIPTQTDTTSTASPDHGETFTTVDSVTRDSNGHVTSINVKTVTLPSSVPAHTHNFLDSKYFSDPALLAAEEGNFFFSGVNLIANVNDWVGLQAGYSMDKFQLIGISQRLGFRQNDTGGSNTSGWSDWKTCLYPEDVTGENGITATLVSSTYGSGATAYVYNTGVKLGHTNSVTAVTNYFRPYMKYDAQGHVTASNYWMHTAKGTDNTAGWVQIATIKHTATNDNTPIVLNIAQRGNSVAYRLHMYWNNANSTDPSLGKFILASDHNWEAITPRAYIIKSATSTWDIYVLKLDKYESIAVTMQPGGYFTRCEWTWKDVQTAESAITGGTEATKKVYSTTDHTHAYLPLAGGTMDTNAEITIPNVNNVAKLTYGSMNFKVGISGGWARGFNFFSDDFSTRIGALGVYGSQNATAPDYMYFGKAYNDTWYRFYKTSCLISDADNAGFDFQYKPANLDAGYSGSFIQLKAAEKYGYGIIIGRRHGGMTMIGAGESANGLCNVIENSLNPWASSTFGYDSENLFNISDVSIYFISGANGLSTSAYTDWTNLKTVLLDSDGFFRPSIDNKGQIGTSDYRWKAVHATEVVGNAVGKDGFIAYPEDGTFSGSDQVAPVSCITITLPIDTSVITSDNYFKVGFKVDMWCYSPLLYYTSDTLTIAGLIMTGNPTLAWYSVTALSNCFPFNVSFGFLNSKAQIQIVIPNVVALYAPEIRIRDIIVIDGFGNHNTFAENKSGWIIESNSGFPAGYEETRFILNSSLTSQPGLMLYGDLIPAKAVIDSTGLLYAGKSVGFYTTNDATTPSYILDSTTENTLSAYAYGNYTIFNIKSKDYARLSFQTTKSGKTYTASGIIMYPLKTSGMTALFSCGGNMVIGGGEFANNAYARKNSSNTSQVGYDNIVTTENEKLYLGADSEVQIISNAGSIQAYNNNDHKVWKFGIDGTLLDPNGLVVTGMDKNSTSYWGMFDGDGVSNNWIRTTTYGFIPYQSGGLTSPHSALGTSTWAYASVWSQNIHGVNLNVYNSTATYKHTITSIASANRTVTLPDTNCTVGTGFFYVLGTQNKKTRMWTGNLPIPALYDGLTIAFYLPFDVKQETTDINDGNVTNVWIKLTLSNGTTTDWVPAYWTNQSRLTTHFVAGSTVMLTYMSNPQVNGSPAAVPVTGWPSNARWTRADYNTNSDTKVNVTLGTTTKAYLLGTSTTPTSTAAAVTTIADTGVYLDTTAGMITATTFNGAATKLSTDAGTEVDPVYFTNGVPTVCKTPNASVSGYGYSSSKPYYKMAETANITSAKTSYRICFLVSKRKIADSTTNASYGIMCVHFESSTSNGTFGYGSVKWLAVENGLDTSSISVKYTTGTNKFSVAIWAKLSSTDDLIIMRSIDNHGFSYESNTAVWSFISNATAAASASGTEIPVTISLLQNTIGGGQSLLYNGSVNLGSTSTSSPAQLTISGNYPLADYQALLIEFWSPGSGNSNRIVVPLRYVRSQTAGTIVWFQLLPTAQSSDATSTNHNNCIGISSNSGGSSYTKKVLVVSGGNITGTWLIRVYSLS